VWSFLETTRIAQLVLKAAILRRGVPDSLYLDRGSAFIAGHLRRSAGVLGIRLIHSRPYRPQGRGKQERLNRFIRDRFILARIHRPTDLGLTACAPDAGPSAVAPPRPLDGLAGARFVAVSTGLRLHWRAAFLLGPR
jgi:putative transposase